MDDDRTPSRAPSHWRSQHERRIRADERRKVAKEIAGELATEYNRMVSEGLAVAATLYGNAAQIARAHATRPGE